MTPYIIKTTINNGSFIHFIISFNIIHHYIYINYTYLIQSTLTGSAFFLDNLFSKDNYILYLNLCT